MRIRAGLAGLGIGGVHWAQTVLILRFMFAFGVSAGGCASNHIADAITGMLPLPVANRDSYSGPAQDFGGALAGGQIIWVDHLSGRRHKMTVAQGAPSRYWGKTYHCSGCWADKPEFFRITRLVPLADEQGDFRLFLGLGTSYHQTEIGAGSFQIATTPALTLSIHGISADDELYSRDMPICPTCAISGRPEVDLRGKLVGLIDIMFPAGQVIPDQFSIPPAVAVLLEGQPNGLSAVAARATFAKVGPIFPPVLEQIEFVRDVVIAEGDARILTIKAGTALRFRAVSSTSAIDAFESTACVIEYSALGRACPR